MKTRLVLLLLVVMVLALFAIYLLPDGNISKAASIPIQDVVVHQKFSEAAHLDRSPWVEARGISVGLVWPEYRDIHPAQRPQTEEITLSVDEPFNPLLIVQMKEETTALVSTLLDFQQVEFELDGQKGLLHEIRLEPGVELEVPIKMDISSPGIHEVVVLVFADPYNNSLDPGYRMSAFSQKYVGRRAIVMIGEENEIARELPPTLPGSKIPEDVELGLGAIFVSQPGIRNLHPARRQLYVAQGRVGATFNYQIWLSNYGEETTTEYALVVFQDYHQAPVSGSDVTIVRLEPNEEAVIDSRVELPRTAGVSQMQIIYVLDPYKSILREEVTAPFVFSSFRIAIEAREVMSFFSR